MSKTWSGLTTREYKKYKGLRKEYLRDNMTNMELLLNALAEETATEISKQRYPEGFSENAGVAKEGAEVAKATRKEVEKRLGHNVASRQIAKRLERLQDAQKWDPSTKRAPKAQTTLTPIIIISAKNS